MGKLSWSVLVPGLLFLFPFVFPRVSEAQGVTNGSFEASSEDISPWVEYGDAVGSDPNNDARVYQPPTFGINQAKDGTNIYGAVRNGIQMEGGIRQRVAGFNPGAYYAVTAWAYTHRVGGSGRVRIGLDPSGGSNPEVSGIVFLPFASSDDEWTQLLLPFVATGSAATIFLEYRLSGSGFSIAYFDLVEIQVDPDLSTDCGVHSNVTLSLENCQVDYNTGPEAVYTAPPGYVITGLGFRAFFQDVTTIRVQMRELLSDGTMGGPLEVRGGSEPWQNLEVNVDLPPCYVMVGFGGRATAETDISTMAVWARPLLPDGSLGPVEEFRTGSEPDHVLEQEFMLSGNRVMIGAGMRTSDGNVTGLYVESCELRTETAQPHPSGLLQAY